MTLGERIQKARQEKQLSQKELATELGKNTVDIALWESNEAVPSISDLTKISSILDVSVDSLVNNVNIGEEILDNQTKSKSDADESIETIESQSQKRKSKIKWGLIIGIIAVIVLGSLIVALALKLPKPFSKDTDAIEKAASSVVKIYCYDYDGNNFAIGSGFIAIDNQTVVTNYHVMENAYTCKISTDQDKTLEVKSIVNYSKENDIAILQLKDSSDIDTLDFGNSDIIKKGETVTAIGSPLGIKNTVSQGILSGRIMEDNMDVLQFTAEISSGSSGGALFNENGEVIGITYASYENGQNLNLAIPIEKVSELYNFRKFYWDLNTIYLKEHETKSEFEEEYEEYKRQREQEWADYIGKAKDK